MLAIAAAWEARSPTRTLRPGERGQARRDVNIAPLSMRTAPRVGGALRAGAAARASAATGTSRARRTSGSHAAPERARTKPRRAAWRSSRTGARGRADSSRWRETSAVGLDEAGRPVRRCRSSCARAPTAPLDLGRAPTTASGASVPSRAARSPARAASRGRSSSRPPEYVRGRGGRPARSSKPIRAARRAGADACTTKKRGSAPCASSRRCGFEEHGRRGRLPGHAPQHLIAGPCARPVLSRRRGPPTRAARRARRRRGRGRRPCRRRRPWRRRCARTPQPSARSTIACRWPCSTKRCRNFSSSAIIRPAPTRPSTQCQRLRLADERRVVLDEHQRPMRRTRVARRAARRPRAIGRESTPAERVTGW